MIESWGRGIERINQACADDGVALPEFRYEDSDLWAIFSFAAQDKKGIASSSKSSPKTEDKILELIRANALITAKQMGEEIGISKRAVLKQISKLKAQQRLQRVGAAKGGSWEILEERKK